MSSFQQLFSKFFYPFFTGSLFICLGFTGCETFEKTDPAEEKYGTWSSYLGDPGRSHYSTLSQITPENVTDLEVAWSYAAVDFGQMQMNPIVVDSLLYGVTAALRIVALNAENGKEIWKFGDSVQSSLSTSRGVSYWQKGRDRRILCTIGPHLWALNALTGKPITSFGDEGKVDMRTGMHKSARDKFVISNTPGTVYKDLIVMPLRLSESEGAPPGDIMAFNVLTGAVEWVFHTIPAAGEPGSETWGDENIRESDIVGAANNWAGMAVDEEAGIIYVPTGSAAPDFYGGSRKGSNLYSNCLLALDADTGERIWHYQITHHDIWDRDLPAPPNLLTVERNGKQIPAVAQVTKQGYVFVFDRRTGEPLFDIEEVPVPSSILNGEEASPTQPIPVRPKPFARQSTDLTEDDISPYAKNREELLQLFKGSDLRTYAPLRLQPTILLPGTGGGAEWGGASADPESGILYVNANELARIQQMAVNNEDYGKMSLGQGNYQKFCASCHGPDRKGNVASGFPTLINIGLRKEKEEVIEIVKNGKGRMPGFPQISEKDKEALLQFLFDQEQQEVVTESLENDKNRIPYKHMGYHQFLDSNGLPGTSPPWGSMHAIDLNTGEYIWSIVLGETPELLEKGIKGTGCANYGGAVVTENGLLFIGATRDGYFRAFDKRTGMLLWEYKLPTAAFATPAMYEVNGTQYIAVACGGDKFGAEKGNRILAFALPKQP